MLRSIARNAVVSFQVQERKRHHLSAANDWHAATRIVSPRMQYSFRRRKSIEPRGKSRRQRTQLACGRDLHHLRHRCSGSSPDDSAISAVFDECTTMVSTVVLTHE